jgi:hypothetical protein
MRTNEDILRAAAGHHVGADAQCRTRQEDRQMFMAGLTGREGGLTRKGSILAERLKSAELEVLFG